MHHYQNHSLIKVQVKAKSYQHLEIHFNCKLHTFNYYLLIFKTVFKYLFINNCYRKREFEPVPVGRSGPGRPQALIQRNETRPTRPLLQGRLPRQVLPDARTEFGGGGCRDRRRFARRPGAQSQRVRPSRQAARRT